MKQQSGRKGCTTSFSQFPSNSSNQYPLQLVGETPGGSDTRNSGESQLSSIKRSDGIQGVLGDKPEMGLISKEARQTTSTGQKSIGSKMTPWAGQSRYYSGIQESSWRNSSSFGGHHTPDVLRERISPPEYEAQTTSYLPQVVHNPWGSKSPGMGNMMDSQPHPQDVQLGTAHMLPYASSFPSLGYPNPMPQSRQMNLNARNLARIQASDMHLQQFSHDSGPERSHPMAQSFTPEDNIHHALPPFYSYQREQMPSEDNRSGFFPYVQHEWQGQSKFGLRNERFHPSNEEWMIHSRGAKEFSRSPEGEVSFSRPSENRKQREKQSQGKTHRPAVNGHARGQYMSPKAVHEFASWNRKDVDKSKKESKLKDSNQEDTDHVDEETSYIYGWQDFAHLQDVQINSHVSSPAFSSERERAFPQGDLLPSQNDLDSFMLEAVGLPAVHIPGAEESS